MGTGLFAVLAVTQRHPPPLEGWRNSGTHGGGGGGGRRDVGGKAGMVVQLDCVLRRRGRAGPWLGHYT